MNVQFLFHYKHVLVHTTFMEKYTGNKFFFRLQCSSETCEHHEHISNAFETRLKHVCLGVSMRSQMRGV